MANDEHDNGAGDGPVSTKVTRRSMLQLLSAAFAACTLPEVSGCGPEEGMDDELELDDADLTVSSRVEVVRARDLLALTIGLSNLRRTAAGVLTRIRPGDAYLVLDFPPQAMLEEALGHAPSNPPVYKTLGRVAAAKLGGPSRLAFLLPTSFVSAPYTLDSILTLCGQSELKLPGVSAQAMRRAAVAEPMVPATLGLHPFAAAAIDRATASIDSDASLRLAQRAQVLGDTKAPLGHAVSALSGPIHPYLNEVTSFVEMPFRVLMAPVGGAAFSHTSVLPADKTAPVELWHTKLCARDPATGLPDARRTAPTRAGVLWTRDNELGHDAYAVPNNASLTVGDRLELAEQASYAQGAGKIEVKRMMLSALGGSLDARAEFPGNADLAKWTHKMTWGREHFVESIKLGFFLPLNQYGIKFEITQRNEDPRMGPVGLLFKYTVVNAIKPLVRFGGHPKAADGADYLRCHDFPFGAVQLECTSFIIPGTFGDNFFLPSDSYPVVAYDQAGTQIKFDTPLYFFVSADGANAKDHMDVVNARLNRAISLSGQRVKYAPSSLDDTTYETANFRLQLREVKAPLVGTFSTAPYLTSAELAVDSVRRVTGQSTRAYEFHAKFRAGGLNPDDNRSQLILSLPGSAVEGLEFKSNPESSTGFVRPNMCFNAVSRTNGPMYDVAGKVVLKGGLDSYLPFDPKKYFDPEENPAAKALAETKLFGAIKLVDIISAVAPADLADDLIKDPLRYAPKFISEAFTELERFLGAFATLEQRLATLHTQARAEAAKIAEIPAAIRARVESELKAIETDLKEIKDRANDLFTAVGKVIKGVQTFSLDSIATITADIGKVFDALEAVMVPVLRLANRVPSKAFNDAVKTPVGIIHGVRRDFENAANVVREWKGKADAIIKMLKSAQAGFEAIRDQTLKLEWRPKLAAIHLTAKDLPIPLSFVPHSDEALSLSIETRAKAKNGKPAGVDFSARLDRFDLRLGANEEKDAPLTLKFKHLEVKQLATRKPDVDVVLADLKFGGPLAFIQPLTDILPRDGFSDPPYLQMEADGIHAGFTLGVPDVAVGVFSMQNVQIKAEVVIPLLGREALKFSFAYCTKESPFLVTVSLLGGGGYFRFELDTAGNILVEGSLCVAASLAINLGVASASVTITAGIFFSFGTAGTTIGGFLCLHGQADVLGIITISIELRLELWYSSATDEVVGRATLKVEVEIAFFSVTVELEFEHRFAGGGSSQEKMHTFSTFDLKSAGGAGSTLRETMCPNPALPESTRYDEWAWKEYVCAFA